MRQYDPCVLWTLATDTGPEPPGTPMIGNWLDTWIPRLLKLLGLVGVALSIVQAASSNFDPILFGGSLTAASGGYLGDALNAVKTGKNG